MSERYTRLFSLQENLHQSGCPVLISAGALLKDNSTGKLIVQLKFRNISDQNIKAVKIKIHAFDTAGIALKGIESFSYLDLNAEQDEEFGSKTPVVLPDKTSRSFSVEILAVAYSSGDVYIPKEDSVAATADSAVLQIVQELNKKRAKEKENQAMAIQEKKIRTLGYLAFFPLIIDLIAIIYSMKLALHPKITSSVIIAIILSLIAPCVCLLGSRLANRHPKVGGFALILVLICLAYQVIASTWYRTQDGLIFRIPAFFSFFVTDYRWGLCSIGGYRLFSYIRTRYIGTRFFFSELLYWIKNIFAIVILFLQRKYAKK